MDDLQPATRNMKRIYLLGYPLSHSLSPAMQNAALQACGFGEWRYEKLPLPPERLHALVETLRTEACVGANVTIPHKQAIIPYLEGLSDAARAIGAVNTVVKRDGKLIGENTDAPGFMQALADRHIRPRHARVFLIGAGGAAAAVAFALADAGARQIVIVNRTMARAAELADQLQARFPDLELAVNWWDALRDANLVINASAIGMAPHADASPLPQGRTIPRGAVAFDLVYNPPATKFLQDAAQAGARCIGGLEMLVYQGALAFELWTGCAAPSKVMFEAAERALKGHLRH